MKITSEISLTNFEFWSGAKQLADRLTYDELDEIESILEVDYPEGMNETELNDLFWFDGDEVCSWIGLTEEEVLDR